MSSVTPNLALPGSSRGRRVCLPAGEFRPHRGVHGRVRLPDCPGVPTHIRSTIPAPIMMRFMGGTSSRSCSVQRTGARKRGEDSTIGLRIGVESPYSGRWLKSPVRRGNVACRLISGPVCSTANRVRVFPRTERKIRCGTGNEVSFRNILNVAPKSLEPAESEDPYSLPSSPDRGDFRLQHPVSCPDGGGGTPVQLDHRSVLDVDGHVDAGIW